MSKSNGEKARAHLANRRRTNRRVIDRAARAAAVAASSAAPAKPAKTAK